MSVDIDNIDVNLFEDLNAYKESTWGKKVEGEYVIDGYKFKGRQPFKNTKEKLEGFLKRGLQSEINGFNFKVLDTRIKGVELEIEIQMSEKSKSGVDSRGVAMVKLYGPNKKKVNTVTITKSKESDIKFVSILALKIIKPLRDNYLSAEVKENMTTNVSIENSKPKLMCTFCQKNFVNESGLKGHITKMHKTTVNTEVLLKERYKDEESDMSDSDTDLIDFTEEKKYSKICSQCGIILEARRKYELLRHIKRHKEICTVKGNFNKSCVDCEYETRNDHNLKRHMRDKHDVLSASTSPPTKKAKILNVEHVLTADEIMDIDDINETITNNLDDEEIISRMMDDKVKEKAKKIEEENDIFSRKQKEKIVEREKLEEIEKESQRILNKQRKQKSKDERKRKNKKKLLEKSEEKQRFYVPNIIPIPKNIEHLVNKGDKIYSVPADGACGPNSASAFLFKDEVFGPKLRRAMNNFFVKHWSKKYQYKTQCSEATPFVRKVGGGSQVMFTDPNELLKYLENSLEAGYMWTDCEDLIVISDMYQVTIKVITTKGLNDMSPRVNIIKPDEEMKKFAEIKNVEMEEMVLLHENDSHFNLVVSGDSELATLGSLSFRTNIGPMTKDTEEKKEEKEDNENESTIKDNKVNQMKAELEKLVMRNKYLENEYYKCEEELKFKTEENEKLKTEVKDLKEVINLGKHQPENDVYMETIVHSAKKNLNCNECYFTGRSRWELSEHIKYKHVDKQETEYNCSGCSFQTTEKRHLNNHIELVHTLKKNFRCVRCDFYGITSSELSEHIERIHGDRDTTQSESKTNTAENHEGQDIIRCRICTETFISKRSLLAHRKKEHLKTVAYCRNNIKGTCVFSSSSCWWNHDNQPNNENSERIIKCYICSETFKEIRSMMVHKKNKHIESIRYCNLFLDNKCVFKEESCWFKHTDNSKNPSGGKENYEKEEQVFQKVQVNLEPPILTQQSNQQN